MKRLRKHQGDVLYYIVPSDDEEYFPSGLIPVKDIENMMEHLLKKCSKTEIRDYSKFYPIVFDEIDKLYGAGGDNDSDPDWTNCSRNITKYLYHRLNMKLDRD